MTRIAVWPDGFWACEVGYTSLGEAIDEMMGRGWSDDYEVREVPDDVEDIDEWLTGESNG